MSNGTPPPSFGWNLQPKSPDEPPVGPDVAQSAPQQPFAPQPPQPAPPPGYSTPTPPQWPTAQNPSLPAPPPAYQPPQNQPPAPPYQPAPQHYQPVPPQYQPAPPPYQPVPPQYQQSPPAQPYPGPPIAPPPPLVQPPSAAFDDIATQAYAFDQTPIQAPPFDNSFRGAEVLGSAHVGLPELRDEAVRPAGQASAIDSLFGESQFRDYEAGVIATDGFTASTQLREREPREPLGTAQKVMLWVAGGLVAALALVGLFNLGMHLSTLIPAPTAAKPTSPAVVVEPQPAAAGPVAPGTYDWDALLGGECLQPFISAWQEQYTVVDCATPHTAQLVFHGYFADEAFASYPGEVELQSRINLLCTTPTSVNYQLASQLSDIQVTASYAATAAEWDAGQRDYYCFVTRSSADGFTASIANPVTVSATLAPTIPSNDP